MLESFESELLVKKKTTTDAQAALYLNYFPYFENINSH